MKNEKLYKTSDLSLASTLAIFFPVIDIDRSNPPRVNFLFIQTPELEETIDKFWRRELKVEPQEYFNSIKNLKNRIHQI
jgi:hypothetical protein